MNTPYQGTIQSRTRTSNLCATALIPMTLEPYALHNLEVVHVIKSTKEKKN